MFHDESSTISAAKSGVAEVMPRATAEAQATGLVLSIIPSYLLFITLSPSIVPVRIAHRPGRDPTNGNEPALLRVTVASANRFRDPPYGVNYANSPKDTLRGKHRPILNDNLGAGFEAFLYDACLNILQVTKGAVYVCMSSSELDTLQRAFRAAGGRWSTFIIWAKNTFTLGRADYQRQYEPILYGWKDGSDHYWCGARDQGDVATRSSLLRSSMTLAAGGIGSLRAGHWGIRAVPASIKAVRRSHRIGER